MELWGNLLYLSKSPLLTSGRTQLNKLCSPSQPTLTEHVTLPGTVSDAEMVVLKTQSPRFYDTYILEERDKAERMHIRLWWNAYITTYEVLLRRENLNLGDIEDFSEAFKWWKESDRVDILGREEQMQGPWGREQVKQFQGKKAYLRWVGEVEMDQIIEYCGPW